MSSPLSIQLTASLEDSTAASESTLAEACKDVIQQLAVAEHDSVVTREIHFASLGLSVVGTMEREVRGGA